MALVSKNLSDIVTLSRASARMNSSSAGVLTSLASGAFGIDYDPATLAKRGMPVEEQRTNGIRNNTMVGAAAGSPGTDPNFWFRLTSLTGLTSTVVGTGTENGWEYTEYSLSGTPSAAGSYDFNFETNTSMAALTGQAWTLSMPIRLTAGSLTGVSSFAYRMNEYTSGGVFISGQTSSAITNPTSAALSTQRQEKTITLNGGATTAYVNAFLRLTLTGAAVDLTIRIGNPQNELGSFASSLIRTTAAAATRLADSLTVGTLSAWFNATEGTLYVEYDSGNDNNFATVASLNDGTSGNQISVVSANFGATAFRFFQVTAGGASQGTPGAGIPPFVANTIYRIASAYKVDSLANSVNGAAAATDSLAIIPTVTQLAIGARTGDGFLNSWIRKIIYYPSRKTDAQLVTLST